MGASELGIAELGVAELGILELGVSNPRNPPPRDRKAAEDEDDVEDVRCFDHEEILPETRRRLDECQRRIGYRFKDPNYLLQALTHSSIKSIDKPCNERMEFLGDSVLGLIITEFLFNFHGNLTEGDLTQIKSVVVSTSTLAEESERLGLDEAFQVGKGVTSKQQLPASLLANVFEAVVCAIYMDGGIRPARAFCVRNLYHHVLAFGQNRHPQNYKSILQQHLQKTDGRTPTYRVVDETGPDHGKTFTVQAQLGKRKLGVGRGRNKKEAEQDSACSSLVLLGLIEDPPLNSDGEGAP